MAVARIEYFRGRGEARFFGTTGANYVSHRAPASVATQYDITWPGAPPAGNRIMQITSGGVISFIAAGGGTLNDSYDFGGAGAGRTITGDTGPVEVTGAGGFQATHSAPVYLLETTNAAQYNWRITADQTADLFEIQRGDQDADISDDTFDTAFVLDGANLRLGFNEAAPGTLVHFTAPAATDAQLTIEAPTGQDSSIIFDEAGTAMFEVGYDATANGFIIGLLTFADPIMTIADTTGHVLFQGNAVNGDFFTIDKPAGFNGDALAVTSASTTGRGLFVDGTAGGVAAVFQTSHSSRALNCITTGSASPCALFDKQGVTTGDAVEIQNAGSGIGLLIDQNGLSGRALVIDSEATDEPLIDLGAVTANTRGDIHLSTDRTALPASPFEGDIFYDATLERMGFQFDTLTRILLSRYGPNVGDFSSLVAIVAGVATGTSARITLAAETGTADTLDTLNTSPQATAGDTVRLQADTGDTITISEATGNFRLDGAADKVLDTVNDNLVVMWNGTQWVQQSFSNNAA